MDSSRLSPQAIASATDLKCEKCESNVFIPVFIIKHISALVSPTGQEINAPVQTFACASCKNINKEFVPFNQ
jgi:hypothetical protein